jgi:lipopolysaccharide heptosyltransferase II
MPKEDKMQKIENILIFHPAGIGDAVLAVPAMKAIREAHPKVYIALVTSKRCLTLVELCPYIDEIFVIEMDAISNPLALLNGEKLSNVGGLISKLRSHRFDVIADFTYIGSRFSAVKRAMLFSLIQGKHIIGRNTQGWGFFLDEKVFDSYPPIKHEVDTYIDVTRPLGVDTERVELELFLTAEDRVFAKSLLKENSIQSEKTIVGINPNGYRPNRKWMKERFAAVADNLICDYDTQVVFIGSKSEMPLVEEIRSLMKSEAASVAGKTNLRQLAALIGQLDLFITNDSGPMHIAAAMKTPIVALFGPQTPIKYAPYCPENMKVVIWKNVECGPCDKIDCANHKCMKLISVEEVLAGAEKLLSR